MKERRTFYFDYNATTPVAPEVLEAMLPLLREHWGNPSSAYAFGKEAARQVETARAEVAALINAEPDEIIFTSCGTESINSALHAALDVPGKNHVVTTAVEHAATVRYCEFLQKRGCEVTGLPVDSQGLVDLGLFEKAIRPETALVSVLWANNETGVIFPVADIAAICHAKAVPLHTDAVQAAGKVKIDVKTAGVDLLSLSAHKLYAPKGIGLLYVRKPVKYQAYILGGHQERDRRAGTENAAGIVAFGRAAELALSQLHDMNVRVRALRDRLEQEVLAAIPNTTRNGAVEPRLPNTSNLSFNEVEAEAVLMLLDQVGICASSGSACASGSVEPSHVLRAMGLDLMRARSAVRFSLGRYSTLEEIEYLLGHLPGVIAKLRAALPH